MHYISALIFIILILKRSVMLQTNESDLLMRYQTTLERRISLAIGNLLVLQRLRPYTVSEGDDL